MVPMEKAALLVALQARLERSERDLSRAAIEWLEVAGTNDKEEQSSRSRKALGELWRREQLSKLHDEVMYKKSQDYRLSAVFFLALDGCNPLAVPSFLNWLGERQKG